MKSERFHRLQELFQAAIERDPEGRETFLAQLTSDDPEMGDELSALLESHREDDPFLENGIISEPIEPTDPVNPMSPMDPMVPVTPLADGQSVGPYRILYEIGRGGMGVVYLAQDVGLRRQVALKALAPASLASAGQQERFRREARVAASLSHPAIATVHALEEVDERFYLVSEYVAGPTLRAEMDREPVPMDVVVDAGVQIAEGLAAAHEKGVVHRDLKPENIVRSGGRQLKIVDFGLALGPDTDFTEPRLTEQGMLIGTPTYMSPEQLQGNRVDFRSDLFNLGVLLCEMATGQHPFAGNTVIETTARILEGQPRLSGHALEAQPKLKALIGRCLEKNPGGRFSSTREVVESLRALDDGLASRPLAPPVAAEVASMPVDPATAGEVEPPGLGRFWWPFHQTVVVGLYAAMVVLLWEAKEQAGNVGSLVCFYGVLASAIANGTLRVHLLFTSRFNPRAIRHELRRNLRWSQAIDGVFTVSLLGGALALLPGSQLMAGVLAGIGIGYAVVFWVIEPATVQAVFLLHPSSDQ